MMKTGSPLHLLTAMVHKVRATFSIKKINQIYDYLIIVTIYGMNVVSILFFLMFSLCLIIQHNQEAERTVWRVARSIYMKAGIENLENVDRLQNYNYIS